MRKSTRLLKENEAQDLVETLYSRKLDPVMIPKGFFIKKRRKGRSRRKPSHYKIVCISLYRRDIERLEKHVRLLKSRGYTKANKSQIIRFAIDKVAIEQMPRVY